MKAKYFISLLIIVSGVMTFTGTAGAQSTAFSYQGRLNAAGSPANGNYDLRFGLFYTNSGGAGVGNLITNTSVPVSNGLFTVTLDFGSVFNGVSSWLETGVRTNGSTNSFTTLLPRQNITASPYALYSLAAGNVTGVLSATNLPANVALLSTNANFVGTVTAGNFTGNGAGLTNLNVANPTGSGAGLTNLVYHVYNVRDYGATDGGADSAAIRAAFTAWTNTGGVLYFPSGIYYDTNHYVIGPYGAFLGVYATELPFLIRGDGKGSTIWAAEITNSTFIVSSNYPFAMRDITLADAAWHYTGASAGANSGVASAENGWSVTWENVGFTGFHGTGLNLMGWAGCDLINCEANMCGTGFSVPGYCDGWDVKVRITACTNAGVSIGDADTAYFFGNKGTSAGHFRVMGANNNIAVIAGLYSAYTVGGYCENSSNCFCAVGHPDGSDASHPPGSITICDTATHEPNVPLAKLYCSPAMLTIRNCGQGAQTNVVSTSSAFDSTRMIFEGVLGNVLVKFSDGTTIPNLGGYTTVNLPEQKYTKLNANPPAQYFGNPASLNLNKSAPSAITPSGSPFNWTNSTGANVFVLYTPGSASDTVAINGTVVFQNASAGSATFTVPLQPGEWLTATYSSSPSAFWKPY